MTLPVLFIYPKKGDPYSLTMPEEKICLGRSSSNEVVLADQFSSGCHAAIFATEGGFKIKDMGSKNGTFVNDQRISGELLLNKGDEIMIGSTRIYFNRDYQTHVEITKQTTYTHSSNTIIQVKDILDKPPTAVFLKADSGELDMAGLERDQRATSILTEVSQALIFHMPLEKLLDHIMDLIIRNIPMDRGILMLKEHEDGELHQRVVRVPNQALRSQNIFISQSIIQTAIDKNSAVLISDIHSDDYLKRQASVVQAKIHSAMCVPLWNNKEIIGLIYCDRISVLEQFREEDLRLLTLLANLAAIKIENARQQQQIEEQERFKQQLELAARIQKNFLPKEDPIFEPYDISGSTHACYQIGGDYFDFISLEPSKMGIVIADVSGSGVGASLLMAQLNGSLFGELRLTKDLAELTTRLNDIVHAKSEINRFISFFMGIVDRDKEEMTYVNAGHNPPYHFDSKGGAHTLDSLGFCLGMFPSVKYETRTISFSPGDFVCLFTDGIVESRNKQQEEFGENRLLDILKGTSALPARDIMDKIYEAVFAFTETDEPEDDITLVILKREKSGQSLERGG